MMRPIMKKFEYLEVNMSIGTDYEKKEEMRKLGDKGWKLTLGHGPDNRLLVFKREIEATVEQKPSHEASKSGWDSGYGPSSGW
jgi:hypothetical protein